MSAVSIARDNMPPASKDLLFQVEAPGFSLVETRGWPRQHLYLKEGNPKGAPSKDEQRP